MILSEIDHLIETIELALEPLEAMAVVQRENRHPKKDWWIERRQTAQQFVEQALIELADLRLLADAGPASNGG